MVYAVLLFFHWSEVMDEQPEGIIYVMSKPRIFTNQLAALDCYANTRCPASTMIEAETIDELNKKIDQTNKNYQDNNWLEANLYPFL